MKTVRICLLMSLLTGCAGMLPDNVIVVMEGNYMTFDHPFTDVAAEDVRTRAGRLCEQRKQAAIKTDTACSLTKCVTHYQCVDKADVKKYGL